MRAKHLKQHLKEVELGNREDEWGDNFWVVAGIKFYDRNEALRYASGLMEEEFRQRYLSKEKK